MAGIVERLPREPDLRLHRQVNGEPCQPGIEERKACFDARRHAHGIVALQKRPQVVTKTVDRWQGGTIDIPVAVLRQLSASTECLTQYFKAVMQSLPQTFFASQVSRLNVTGSLILVWVGNWCALEQALDQTQHFSRPRVAEEIGRKEVVTKEVFVGGFTGQHRFDPILPDQLAYRVVRDGVWARVKRMPEVLRHFRNPVDEILVVHLNRFEIEFEVVSQTLGRIILTDRTDHIGV